jgi:hypothetical protein
LSIKAIDYLGDNTAGGGDNAKMASDERRA